jgi:acyl-CoA synthetase (AMP-forming)/AMP-acid ligase II
VHRLLALPGEVRERYRTDSLRLVLLAGAPCPVEDKRRTIEWLGPIVWEYLGSTEGSVCHVSPQEWLEHPGTVGRPAAVKILDSRGEPVPAGEAGTIYFPVTAAPFEYHNDPAKTAAAIRPDGFATVGDIGRLDAEGYLYLLDRRDDLIISGGVNIYPAEVEQHLLKHPAVAVSPRRSTRSAPMVSRHSNAHAVTNSAPSSRARKPESCSGERYARSSPAAAAMPQSNDKRGIMGTLEGRVAIVTGGGRGIGAAIARRFAAGTAPAPGWRSSIAASAAAASSARPDTRSAACSPRGQIAS